MNNIMIKIVMKIIIKVLKFKNGFRSLRKLFFHLSNQDKETPTTNLNTKQPLFLPDFTFFYILLLNLKRKASKKKKKH